MQQTSEVILTKLHDRDAWLCICGNTPSDAGFCPIDETNHEVEPTPEDWLTGHYVCRRCGRVIDPESLRVERRIDAATLVRLDGLMPDPEFVQDLTEAQDVGLVIKENYKHHEEGLPIEQYYGTPRLCDLRGGSDACSDDGILWNAGDIYAPYLCTTHFFPAEQFGYEFYDAREEA